MAVSCGGCGESVDYYSVRFTEAGSVNLCRLCAKGGGSRNVAGSTFPFMTTHFDGKPTEVNSLYALRKLESRHGVASAAYNVDSRNLGR